MPIAQNPQYNPSSGYRPVEWIVFTTENPSTAGEIVLCTADVDFNGLPVGQLRAKPYTVVGPGPVFTYGFKIDVSEIFQNLTAPLGSKSLCFGTPSAQYNAIASDCAGLIDITLEYFYIDGTTGLLTSQGFTETTVQQPIFIATRQHEEDMALTNYVMGSVAAADFLTNSPSSQDICLNESLFINFIKGTADTIRIDTYNSLGVVIDTGFLATAGGATSRDQVAFGIGPNEIRATTFTSGSVNIDNPNVSYYVVSAGQFGGPYVLLSELKTFNIVPCCEEYTRLHFLNRLGGTDAFTFRSLNVKRQSTTSDTARKPLAWNSDTATPHSINDFGVFKTNTRAFINRQLESKPLTPTQSGWLAELLSSPEVYLETSAGLVLVNIEDVEQDLTTNTSQELPLVRFSIVSADSNERSIQQR